ncbi:MAG: hypothetical protein NTZ09_13330 [Candidatus Hydrogenedentes bacterium]|nr:hypothetical protein [Candidatus Hydrogenedentota bacterium]
MPITRVAGILAVCLVAASVCSCSIFRHGKSEAGAVAPVAAGPASPAVSDTDREAALLKVVQQSIDAAKREGAGQRDSVIQRKPYFFKAYDIYSGNAEDAKVVIQEKDSHSLPYIADVTIEKQRFATRLHRKRIDAERDTSFLRETGAETVTYEYRNGKWQRAGSLFLAEKKEEQVNGEWAAVKEEPKPAMKPESSRGWLSRAWSAITGN